MNKGIFFVAVFLSLALSSCQNIKPGKYEMQPYTTVVGTDFISAVDGAVYIHDIIKGIAPAEPKDYTFVKFINTPRDANELIESYNLNSSTKERQGMARIANQFAQRPFAAMFRHKKSPNRYLISFRGTADLDDVIYDLDFKKIPFVPFKGNINKDVLVHRGFFTIYKAIRRKLFKQIDGIRIETLEMSGHSLGSALAAFFTYDVQVSRQKNEMPREVHTILYGSPRVGNSKFIKDLTEVGGNQIISAVANHHDLVTKVPPRILFGYADFNNTVVISFTKNKERVREICNGIDTGSLSSPLPCKKSIFFWHNIHNYSDVIKNFVDSSYKIEDYILIDQKTKIL